MTTATLTVVSDDPMLKELGEREVVLVPLDQYNALLDRLEGLENLVDMLEALKEPRRPFVLIDLKRYGELWEDFYDALVARQRADEPRESLESVREALQRQLTL